MIGSLSYDNKRYEKGLGYDVPDSVYNANKNIMIQDKDVKIEKPLDTPKEEIKK